MQALPDTVVGGEQAFIERAVEIVAECKKNVAAPAGAREQLAGLSEVATRAALEVMKCAPAPVVSVDVRGALSNISLDGLEFGCLPQSSAADTLGSKGAALVKKKIARPFIFAEISDFVPHWCITRRGDETGDDATPATSARQRLTIMQWSVGFERYALAAAATDPVQWEFAASYAHKDIIMQVYSYVLCNA